MMASTATNANYNSVHRSVYIMDIASTEHAFASKASMGSIAQLTDVPITVAEEASVYERVLYHKNGIANVSLVQLQKTAACYWSKAVMTTSTMTEVSS